MSMYRDRGLFGAKARFETRILPASRSRLFFNVHGGIAKHYGVNSEDLGESHAATIDYLIAAVAG